MKFLPGFLILLFTTTQSIAQNGIKTSKKNNPIQSSFTTWATKPPMGWNSYDAFHGVVTEEQLLESIEAVRQKLLPLGYNYVTIDFCWFNPGLADWAQSITGKLLVCNNNRMQTEILVRC